MIDTDGDRMSGMWTLQSHLSASGWNLVVDSAGTILRHRGPPTRWNFEEVGAAQVVEDGAVTFCIPVESLARKTPDQIAVVAETSAGSLPPRFLAGASFPPIDRAAVSQPFTPPGRLAFNYSGTPWSIRGRSSHAPTPRALRCAARAYERFDQIVLDADFSSSAVPAIAKLVSMLRSKKPALEVWGYVSIVGSTKSSDGLRQQIYEVGDILAKAKLFQDLGATAGSS